MPIFLILLCYSLIGLGFEKSTNTLSRDILVSPRLYLLPFLHTFFWPLYLLVAVGGLLGRLWLYAMGKLQ
jgi:hypothetical protein